ncbi:MAG: ABC-2 transporter permease [Planctomycetota bacterium]|nr:ABC-2 transporter permease [Planctomycetota bacterium]
MKAEANLEVYRPFAGTLREHPRAAVALWKAGLRVAFRRRLALMLLMAPPVIAAVIFSFVVYTRYSLEQGSTPEVLGGTSVIGQMAGTMVKDMAAESLAVRKLIVMFHLSLSAFSLLVVAWYGAGLIAEDRRNGAHLLVFARPLSRTGYVLGRFLTVATFGSLAAIAPTLVVCVVATFASPDWSFVRLEGDVILKAILYGVAWVTSISAFVLAASSLATRKAFALAGTFGIMFGLGAISTLLAQLQREPAWRAISPGMAWARIANEVFGVREMRSRWDPEYAYLSVSLLFLASCAVIAWRVRRMEAVA